MTVIGLTGATGAGKGFFGKNSVHKHGALHIDTDKIARLVAEPGKPCLDEIRKSFGEGIVNEDGSLDRKALGSIVFSDRDKLALLNKITHKYITAEVRSILEKARKDGYSAAIIDAPLLFESGEDSLCDVTVGVIANADVRCERIMKRDGITREVAEKRIASGKSDEFFIERCDYIIENNSDAESYAEKADRIMEEILAER